MGKDLEQLLAEASKYLVHPWIEKQQKTLYNLLQV
jgi:hypothetical protein